MQFYTGGMQDACVEGAVRGAEGVEVRCGAVAGDGTEVMEAEAAGAEAESGGEGEGD